MDSRTGDTICRGKDNEGCGNVVQDHHVDEGQQFRRFADEPVRHVSACALGPVETLYTLMDAPLPLPFLSSGGQEPPWPRL